LPARLAGQRGVVHLQPGGADLHGKAQPLLGEIVKLPDGDSDCHAGSSLPQREHSFCKPHNGVIVERAGRQSLPLWLRSGSSGCPEILMMLDATPDDSRDDRKTARLAGWVPQPRMVRDDKGVIHVHEHALARAVLRAPEVEQNGFGADLMRRAKASLMRLPVLFLEGHQHQELRRATARFFAPRTVEDGYLTLMQRETDRLVDRLQRDKRGRLDVMAMDMSVTVAAEIAGLTEHVVPGMADRIARFLNNPPVAEKWSPALIPRIVLSQFKLLLFYLFDVRPNIRLRRKAPRADVISHLI